MLSPVYTGPNIVTLFVATEYHSKNTQAEKLGSNMWTSEIKW